MHTWLINLKAHRQKNLLSYRLLIYILICSTLLTILSSGIQLYWDYRSDVRDIEKEIYSIEAGYLDSLSSSLWKLDQEQIDIQLDGIMKIPDIGYSSITEIVDGKPGSINERGVALDDYPINNNFDLFYRDILVGKLHISATLDHVYERLFKRFLVILASQAIKTFLASIFILMIVHYLVVRHLNRLRQFTSRLDLNNLDEHLHLHKNRSSLEHGDAIDQLVDSINDMRDNINNQLTAKKAAKQELQSLNEELEQRVLYRTATLKHTNERLTEVLSELTETKDRLIETEKMAALGELFSTVSQELNTPVNSSLTTLKEIQTLCDSIGGPSFADQQSEIQTQLAAATQSIEHDLQKTAKLITTFEQVTTDQTTQPTQRFNLLRNASDAVATLKEELEAANCEVSINCYDKLEMLSYPAACTQIYQNLITNSLLHGFEGRDQGNSISIDITREKNQIKIDYSDNGKGVPEPIKHRIFDPFVTGKPGDGSGLGTHLVHNLVTQLLGGTISVESARGNGSRFTIIIPTQMASNTEEHAHNVW